MADPIRGRLSDNRLALRPGPIQLTPQDEKERQFKRQLAVIKGYREQDLAAGRRRGEELFAEGSLGRVSEQRPQEMADLIAARKANLVGFTPEETNALADQQAQAIGATTQNAMRTLRGEQGRAGYSGGIAAGQIGQVLRQDARSRAEANRDLFLKQIEARRSALDALEQTTGNVTSDELKRQMYNQEQKNAEQQGRLTTEFGYAGLGAAERGGVMQQIVGQEQAKALAAQAQKSGGKK